MIHQSDTEYFAARAEVERGMSSAASEPAVALIHSQFASCYDRLVEDLKRSRLTLQMAEVEPTQVF